ncbi:MAG: hypothetical protein ABFC71_04475 [Methanoregula sp.]
MLLASQNCRRGGACHEKKSPRVIAISWMKKNRFLPGGTGQTFNKQVLPGGMETGTESAAFITIHAGKTAAGFLLPARCGGKCSRSFKP